VVPHDLTGFFTASSAVAGTLIGLLFVSIQLRYDDILGTTAQTHSRAIANAAFTALANALAVSLWALVPTVNLGYPTGIIALFCVYSTLKSHLRQDGPRALSLSLLGFSMVVYVYQVVICALLVMHPHDRSDVDTLAYGVFAAMAAGLSRCWQLLQSDAAATTTSEAPVTP
jgi:ABC-type dipeptide/oligopeptide/nickel transport system permease component